MTEDDSSSSSGEDEIVAPSGFPKDSLDHLVHEMCKSSQWRVVFDPLNTCLRKATAMSLAGEDTKDPLCKKFISHVVIESLDKLTSSDAALNWKDEIHNHVFDTLMNAVELGAAKIPTMDSDSARFVHSLVYIFDASSNFNVRNRNSMSKLGTFECTFVEPQIDSAGPMEVSDTESEGKNFGGGGALIYQWLTDLANHFGNKGGFDAILNRIVPPRENFDFGEIAAMLAPLGMAAQFATDWFVTKYLDPICKTVLGLVRDMTDKQLKTQNYAQIVSALDSCLYLLSRQTKYLEACEIIDMVRLNLALRMLKIQSFERQLGAVKEIHELIKLGGESGNSSKARYGATLSHATMCKWLVDCQILPTALQSHLHHKQFVEQIAKITRFMLRNDCVTDQDLELLWACTEGKHESIVSNLYDMIAALTPVFKKSQLDLFFGKLEVVSPHDPEAMTRAVQLVTRLSSGDDTGDLCSRVLELLWDWAHNGECGEEVQSDVIHRLPEVLHRYDSWGFASRESFIQRCLVDIRQCCAAKSHVACAAALVSIRLLHRIIGPCCPFSNSSFCCPVSRLLIGISAFCRDVPRGPSDPHTRR